MYISDQEVLLDMNAKPVQIWIMILRLLFSKDMSVNNIFQQTGLTYKKRVTDAIMQLEKAQIIGNKTDPKHKQREIKYLTDVGREIGDIIISLDDYESANYGLHIVAKEKVFILMEYLLPVLDDIENIRRPHLKSMEEDTVKEVRKVIRKLIQIGWTYDEIEFYNHCRTQLIELFSLCQRSFIDILLLRYARILNSKKLNLHATKIFEYIIMNAINNKVVFMLNNIETVSKGYFVVRTYRYPPDIRPTVIQERTSSAGVFQLIIDFVGVFLQSPLPSILKREIWNLSLSYLSLLKPPLANLELFIWDIRSSLDNDVANISLEEKQFSGREEKLARFQMLIINQKQLFLELYKEYCKTQHYVSEVLGK
jgi:DNA-binding HxlR family transcriptional regulator